jgi:hypothetical protein
LGAHVTIPVQEIADAFFFISGQSATPVIVVNRAVANDLYWFGQAWAWLSSFLAVSGTAKVAWGGSFLSAITRERNASFSGHWDMRSHWSGRFARSVRFGQTGITIGAFIFAKPTQDWEKLGGRSDPRPRIAGTDRSGPKNRKPLGRDPPAPLPEGHRTPTTVKFSGVDDIGVSVEVAAQKGVIQLAGHRRQALAKHPPVFILPLP